MSINAAAIYKDKPQIERYTYKSNMSPARKQFHAQIILCNCDAYLYETVIYHSTNGALHNHALNAKYYTR